MSDNPINIIREADLELEFSELGQKYLGGNFFVDWAREHVLEAIDYHANELTDEHSIVQIPELTIQVNFNSGNNFFKDSEGWSAVLNERILTALKKALADNKVSGTSVQLYRANIVLSYIRTGFLRQHVTDQKWEELITAFFEEILVNNRLQAQWFGIIQGREEFIRFFELLNERKLLAWLERWTGVLNLPLLLNGTLALFELNPGYFRPTSLSDFYFKVITQLPVMEMSLVPTLQRIIEQNKGPEKAVHSELVLPGEIRQEIPDVFEIAASKDIPNRKMEEISADKDGFPDIEEKGAYVNQAGLVLLAPFLPAFVKDLGYADNKGNLVKPRELPMLFHYIATGRDKAFEWSLSLPKLLAGLELRQHCDTTIKTTAKLDKKINNLLQSVIEHWAVLKKTSPDGLRNTFLMRNGELKFRNGFYFLYIEEETVDILLSYISWNYMTIKLDWMRDILFVKWNNQS
ncbi:MAG TPA: contractile injection system tape measure protein [Eudoraea sp.]|nr:contractile injection system tape measure protein [Eudoraea sp.]